MDLLAAFARYEREAVVAQNTLRNYRRAIQGLEAFGVGTLRELTRPTVGRWLASKEGLLPGSLKAELMGVLALASWLEHRGLFPLHRLLELRRLKPKILPPAPPAYLRREELARLRLQARALNDQLELAIAFAVFAGLRLDELRRLHREDLVLDHPEPFLRVLRERGETKTRRSRVVPLARAFAEDLKARDLQSGPIFTPKFKNCTRPFASKCTLANWLTKARDRAQLYHVSWRTLRHTFASWLRQGGVELSKVSGWMGNTVRICEAFYAAMGPGGDLAVEKGFAQDDARLRPTGSDA